MSPSRNRSVRSDFILNLVQQGISSENESLLNNLDEVSEHNEDKSIIDLPTTTTTTTTLSSNINHTTTSTPAVATKSSPSHKYSGSTMKAMLPQPYNQTKQFKRFSIEEPEPLNKHNLETEANIEDDATDQTVESFGSVQEALNLDTTAEDIQLESKLINQSASAISNADNQSKSSFYLDK